MNHKLVLTFLLATAFGLTSDVRSESAVSRVTVRVKAVNKLEVTDGGLLNLDGVPGSVTLGPVSDSTASLSITHNKATSKKITAESQPAQSPNPSGNDIVLRVSVQGGTGEKVVYGDSGSTGTQEVVSGLSPGALTGKAVTYTAQCTTAGTALSEDTDFAFTVTFTSVDE